MRRQVPIPRPSDCIGTEEHDSSAFLPTNAPTEERAAKARALVDAEQQVAQTHRSGTRPAVQQVPDESDTWSFDPHNAVTKVQRAIELDAFLPPTLEVTVVVSSIVALGPPETHAEAPMAARSLPLDSSPVTEAGNTSSPSHVDHRPAPLPSRHRARRAIAALLVVATMTGACALLLTAAWRAHVRLPPPLAHLVERAVEVTRGVSGISR
jgi:hypothetical protein